MFLSLSPCRILGQVWYLIVSIPDICPLSYFKQDERIRLYTKGCDILVGCSNTSNRYIRVVLNAPMNNVKYVKLTLGSLTGARNESILVSRYLLCLKRFIAIHLNGIC